MVAVVEERNENRRGREGLLSVEEDLIEKKKAEECCTGSKQLHTLQIGQIRTVKTSC